MHHYHEKLQRHNTICKKNMCEENICIKNKNEWINCIRRFKISPCPITYRECTQHWTDFIICSNKQK